MVAAGKDFTGPKENSPLTEDHLKCQKITRANDIRGRTLKIKLNTKVKPYNRLDIGLSPTDLVPTGELEYLCPLSPNTEWYLTLRNDASEQKLLTAGDVVVNNFKGNFESSGFRGGYQTNV